MVLKQQQKGTQFGKNGSKPNSYASQLLEFFFNPTPDQLTGLTRTALDKALPNSGIRVFAEEAIRLCELAKASQELYTANWKIWHSDQESMSGIGKRLRHREFDEEKWKRELKRNRNILNEPDVDAEGHPIKFELPNSGVEQATVDVKKDSRFKTPSLTKMIGVKFLYQYMLNRRSTIPDVVLEYFGLTGRTIEMGKNDDEDGNRIIRPQ